jgi:hypothetical protein
MKIKNEKIKMEDVFSTETSESLKASNLIKN